MQEKYKIDNVVIWQPDQDLAWNHETTYTSDSTRTQDGTGHFTEMFTTESFGYQASHVPVAEVSKLLKLIIGRKFNLYGYNPYFGKWMTMRCYVGQGSLSIGTLEEGHERISSISFNIIDLKPLEKYT